MEQPQIQCGVSGRLVMPFSAAVRSFGAEGPGPEKTHGRNYKALAITEGKFNGTVFEADELKAMVDRINSSNRVGQIRIVEEHDDSVGALLGRGTSLSTEVVNVDGADLQGSVIGFALFDKLQRQQDAITQLDQAPDLIGLSVAICGDLVPQIHTEAESDNENVDWTWKNIDLIHVALVTYPACSATAGTIMAAYKTADGAVFNPTFFMDAPISDVMESTTHDKNLGTVTPSTTAAQTALDNNSGVEGPQSYAVPPEAQMQTLQDCLEIAALGQTIGVDLDKTLLLGMSPSQRQAYKADMVKIVEKFSTSKTSETEKPPEKGAEFAGSHEPDYEKLGADFISGTGSFANFGKKLGGN